MEKLNESKKNDNKNGDDNKGKIELASLKEGIAGKFRNILVVIFKIQLGSILKRERYFNCSS